MARVQITVRALADLERLFDFLAEHNPKLARERILSVRRAFELLADHPLLGRQVEDGRRELILSRGRFGYVAKYRWVPAEDVILILAVRHQLEAGYKEEERRRCVRFPMSDDMRC
jgi:plasmid stabilization system protein ParE